MEPAFLWVFFLDPFSPHILFSTLPPTCHLCPSATSSSAPITSCHTEDPAGNQAEQKYRTSTVPFPLEVEAGPSLVCIVDKT